MDIDVINLLFGSWEWIVRFFSDSFFVVAIKFFLFVYVSVLLADIVLLIILRGISSDLKKTLYGADRPLMRRSSVIKRWEKILAGLESGNPSQYKVSVLEADTLADEVLGGIGYRGATMGEKLSNVKEGQIETRDALVSAHEVRNRIVHEADFVLSREEAENLLHMYRKFFDEMELF